MGKGSVPRPVDMKKYRATWDRIFGKRKPKPKRYRWRETTSIAILLLLSTPCYAIPDSTAIRCIVGEAGGEPYEGQVAVGEALRNRGTTKGVYGCTRKLNEPKWVYDMASLAWHDSDTSDLVHGASYWENVEQFGMPRWAYSMTETAHIGHHRFFRDDSYGNKKPSKDFSKEG